MNPYSTFVMIYAIGFLASAGFTMHALRVLRENRDEDPRNDDALRPYDHLQDASGIRDSGLAIIAGIVWPRLLWDFLVSWSRRNEDQQ